jgi:hypothetical protein
MGIRSILNMFDRASGPSNKSKKKNKNPSSSGVRKGRDKPVNPYQG